jgi:hypothetical protein
LEAAAPYTVAFESEAAAAPYTVAFESFVEALSLRFCAQSGASELQEGSEGGFF